MKKLIKLILCLTLALVLCPFALAEETDLATRLTTLEADIADAEAKLAQLKAEYAQTLVQHKLAQGAVLVQIDIANYGVITLELLPEAAPITVANFVKLAKEGFYDGLTFHRIISGFMIQGGDPNGNGTGGSSERIKGEFSQNGVDNPLKHERGVISMARSSSPDSASSQFFIMHEDSPHLDGAYAAFGKVLSGIEVVDAICDNTPVIDYNGTVAPGYAPVITSVKVLEKAE